MSSVYTLRGVEKWYASHCVLRIPDLELDEGGITAIVGPNGSGKTTLLRMLAFLDAPSEGRISLAARFRRQDVVSVEQAPFLFRGTVASNVAYGLRARGIPSSEQKPRIEAALERLGLADLARRRAHRLSGGERRRTALARAWVLAPPVLLLDEPVAEIDVGHAGRIEALLREHGRERTVIFTTHDLAQAHRLSRRVLSLVGGRLSPVSILNAFQGTVTQRGGSSVFRSAGIEIAIAAPTPNATLAAIDPEALVISIEPVRSSARNSLPGTITRVEGQDGSLHLTVDCGLPLVAAITRASYDELGLNVGRRVWITFKSTAVHLY